MAIVRHPTLPTIRRDVEDPEEWVKHGWVNETPPVEPDPDPVEVFGDVD